MNVLLISTYELGRQPFGLASPAAWLAADGVEVSCLDLSRQPFDETLVRRARLIAFHVPMHTATRLAIQMLAPIRALNPEAHLCFYGLYAPVNESWLRQLGVHTILGGEFEGGLAHLARRLAGGSGSSAESSLQLEPVVSFARQQFRVPLRDSLPPLESYARLMMPDGGSQLAGYTEASRGCKHLCRHCPIVPVYGGKFRVIPINIVLEDVSRQIAAGASHITFGDPDFFNAPGHALPLVEEFHRRFPSITWDATIKVEHLLLQASHLPALRRTGCIFITSAVESLDDSVLVHLDKGHTRADFFKVAALCDEHGIGLQPTFVPFTPWTTPASYLDLLDSLASLGFDRTVAPIQLAIRLLIPAGSRLLELPEISALAPDFDPAALLFPWRHPNPLVDELCTRVQEIVQQGEAAKTPRSAIFGHIRRAALETAGITPPASAQMPPPPLIARAAIPYLNEPWYCCAEPAEDQFVALTRATRHAPPKSESFV
jgi:radical SAM superfamily enzyme YgiQ (UPF0313 family)